MQSNELTGLSKRERFEARKAALWLSPRTLSKKSKDPYQVVLACRAQAPLIIKRLVELTQSTHGPTAVKACEVLLNRAYGRAPIVVDITAKLTADRAMLEQTAAAIIERRRERALLLPSNQSNQIEIINAALPHEGGSAPEAPGGVWKGSPPKKVPQHTQLSTVNIDSSKNKKKGKRK